MGINCKNYHRINKLWYCVGSYESIQNNRYLLAVTIHTWAIHQYLEVIHTVQAMNMILVTVSVTQN